MEQIIDCTCLGCKGDLAQFPPYNAWKMFTAKEWMCELCAEYFIYGYDEEE